MVFVAEDELNMS